MGSNNSQLRTAFAPEKPSLLYHCVNQPLVGNVLRAGCRREVNGREADFLFAGSYLSKALPFAFDYNRSKADGILANGVIEGTPDEYAIVTDRDKTFKALPQSKVYAFSSEGFEEAWPGEDSRQWVSQKDVSLDKSHLVLEIDSVDDLMRNGLQIFSTDKTVEELGGKKFLDGRSGGVQGLGELLESGEFRWENRERGINPNPALELALGLRPAVRVDSPQPGG